MDPVRWSSSWRYQITFWRGGFWRAFEASSWFQNKSWVLMNTSWIFKEDCWWVGNWSWISNKEGLSEMHYLSSHLDFVFEQLCNSSFDSFGQSFSRNKIYYGLYGGEHVTIEESVNGELTKYINNTWSVVCEREIGQKGEAFIHFTVRGLKIYVTWFTLSRLPTSDLLGVGHVWSRNCDYWSSGLRVWHQKRGLFRFGKSLNKCNT